MTREELLKMSKKDLKNRLAELGKNAQTLSGQELTDAVDLKSLTVVRPLNVRTTFGQKAARN